MTNKAQPVQPAMLTHEENSIDKLPPAKE